MPREGSAFDPLKTQPDSVVIRSAFVEPLEFPTGSKYQRYVSGIRSTATWVTRGSIAAVRQATRAASRRPHRTTRDRFVCAASFRTAACTSVTRIPRSDLPTRKAL